MRLEAHHLFWTRAEWNERPISKQVRKLACYIIDIPTINHRLLHATLTPPEVPDIQTLRDLREIAPMGLEIAQNEIKHPIIEHIGRQLLIATLDQDLAQDLLDTGEYHNFFENYEY